MILENFSNVVLAWFEQHGRKDLPWQKDVTPYRVWLSEIMLQQTQVKTVIPYFEQFISQFPNVDALSKADIDQVLSLWSGLGYYARARNLHETAKRVVSTHKGEFPTTLEGLQALPGIGRSTAGAILSMGMQKRAPILDGNVKRVLCRYCAIEGWHGKTSVQKQLWTITEQATPQTRVAHYTQAMMDLGAMVCTRNKPNCAICPLRQTCQAYQKGEIARYPYSKPKKEQPIRAVYLLLLRYKDEILLYKRPPVGIWGGLWSLPEYHQLTDIEALSEQYQADCQVLPDFRHTFSHFHLDITPVCLQIKKKPVLVMDSEDQVWYKLDTVHQLGLSAPVKKLLKYAT